MLRYLGKAVEEDVEVVEGGVSICVSKGSVEVEGALRLALRADM